MIPGDGGGIRGQDHADGVHLSGSNDLAGRTKQKLVFFSEARLLVPFFFRSPFLCSRAYPILRSRSNLMEHDARCMTGW